MRTGKQRVLLCVALGAGALACAAEGPMGPMGGGGDGAGGGDTPVGDYYLLPEVVHTGFDGTSEFAVPVGTNLPGPITWEVEDPSILEIAPTQAPSGYRDEFAMVKTVGAGTTRVFAISGDQMLEATVIVAEYSPAQLAAGEDRYNVGGSAPEERACASCHQAPGGADHSPFAIGVFEDAAILQAVETGVYPSGYELQGVVHQWTLSQEARDGIVPYLRALPPRGF